MLAPCLDAGSGGSDMSAGRVVPAVSSDDADEAIAIGQRSLLDLRDVSVDYDLGPRTGNKKVRVLQDVTFAITAGKTLGLVGESGSGKTTTGRAVLRTVPLAGGSIEFAGQDISSQKGAALRRLRRRIQPIHQDPYASLNPRMSVLDLVAEPLIVHGVVRSARAATDRVGHLLERCGLPRDSMRRLPNAFSGGQRQRIGIARALALEPDLIVADEPVSALDVSIQAQIVNLMQDLQQDLGLTMLFIAHDLSVVRHVSDDVAIMYGGEVVEIADRDSIYVSPRHPYTQALLSAVPQPGADRRGRERIVLAGDPSDPANPPPGCRLHPRCPFARPGSCDTDRPVLRRIASGHEVACHWAEEIPIRPAWSEG